MHTIARLLRHNVISRKALHALYEMEGPSKSVDWKAHTKARHQWGVRPNPLQRARIRDVMRAGVDAEVVNGKWYIQRVA